MLLLSASPSGAAFAHAHLLEVLRTMMGAHLVDGGAHVFSRAKLDASGAITAPRSPLRSGQASRGSPRNSRGPPPSPAEAAG